MGVFNLIRNGTHPNDDVDLRGVHYWPEEDRPRYLHGRGGELKRPRVALRVGKPDMPDTDCDLLDEYFD